MTIHSYSSIFNLGHREAKDLFSKPVVVQEKIDGSQFSFRLVVEHGDDGFGMGESLEFRSKGAEIIPGSASSKMFNEGITAVKLIKDRLTPNWTYRGEYLRVPKHNTLGYARVPVGHVVIFDIDRADQDYLSPAEVAKEACRIGFDAIPTIYEGVVSGPDHVAQLLKDHIPLLGGAAQAEGLVFKRYDAYSTDKKILMGKYVTEAFKEAHQTDWKATNPGGKDVVEMVIANYRTDARFTKAVQHLRDGGELTDTVKDIGPLMKELARDLKKEEEDAIKEMLWRWAKPKIMRGISHGFPQWYKDRLLANSFEVANADFEAQKQ